MLKLAGLAAFAVVLFVPIGLVAVGAQTATDLVVHEWGTFTSVAGEDGQAVPWHPLSGSSDLPCFVTQLNPGSVKFELIPGSVPADVNAATVNPAPRWLASLPATVRMETPVLYFYSAHDTAVAVSVQFHHGLVTEWYPRAVVPPPPVPVNFSGTGRIEWPSVQVRPGSTAAFPTGAGSSHYYAARATDAAPVFVDGQAEKFLFYRGLATFPPSIRARDTGRDAVVVENAGAEIIPHVVLFESDGKHIGYRVIDALSRRATIPRPELTNDVASLRRDLSAMLVEQGLFPREAEAMLETWRDSWFEPGVRVFYIVPRASVDDVLSLGITPAPHATSRVFVGRMEVLTQAMEQDISRAMARGDYVALARYGRFLEPAMDRLWNRAKTADERARIDTAFDAAAKALAAERRTCQ